MAADGERCGVVVLGAAHRAARGRGVARELARRGHRVALVAPELGAGAPGWQPTADMAGAGEQHLHAVTLPSHTAGRVEDAWTATDLRVAHDGLVALVDALGLRCPVLLVQGAGWAHLVGLLQELTDLPVVSDLTPTDAARAPGVVRGAGLVLAPCAGAAPALRALNRHVVVVPDGCETTPPGGGDGRARLVPPLTRPLVGYAGDGPVDVRLLAALAESCPDWSFPVVADLPAADLRALDAYANVYVLPGVAHEDRAAYAAEFDVALVPLPAGGAAAERFPAELLQLLAVGLPVVSTPHPDALELQAAGVAMAADPLELAGAIRRALDGPHDPAAGRRAVAAASWVQRVDRFATELETLLPSLDVVVTSYESPEPLARCLQSIARDGSHPAQVIVVDNASGPPTQAVLDDAEAAGAIVDRRAANDGFPAAVNRGVARGRGRYVLILNDDVQLPAGGLLAFVHALATGPRAGLVGPTTNRIANEARVDVPYDERHPPDAVVDAVHAERAVRYAGQGFDIRVAALFAAIVRRADFEALGGLSARYQLGQFDDDDLSHRLRDELGLRVICRDDIFVHHAGMTAFGALDGALLDGLFTRNRRVFERQTRAPWQPHRLRDDDNPTMEHPMTDSAMPLDPAPAATGDRVAELEAELDSTRRDYQARLRALTERDTAGAGGPRSVDTGLYELLLELERERQELHTRLHAEHHVRVAAEAAAAAAAAERDALAAELEETRRWTGILEQRTQTLEASLAWRLGRAIIDSAKRVPGARLLARLTGRGA
jgi:GT2 family glycosyltransferase